MPEKILIVDDDIDTLRLVGMMLERQGYQIVAASSGQIAVSLAKKESPDLILLDIMMPGLDGYNVARILRDDEETKDIPIIIFTAKSQMDDKLLGFEVGADDYLTKPTQTRELLARIRAVLKRSARARTSAVAAERGHLLAVIAPKGGLGVTTLALNVGVALRRETQKEVIVADFRPGQGSLGLQLGYARTEGFNRLLACATEEIKPHAVENELLHHSSGIRLLLSSPQPRDARLQQSVEKFEAVARALSVLARYVVIDLGVGLTPVSEKVLAQCQEILVVTEPIPQTVCQAKALIQDMLTAGAGESQIQAILFNRVPSTMQLSLNQVQDLLGRKIAIVFPPDPELAFQASSNNLPMILQQPESLAAQQFGKLAAQITQRSG